MRRPLRTVLTAPVPTRSRRWYQAVRRTIRPFVKPGVALPHMSPYPGHYALVRSVVEGLREIGADFNFNPRQMRGVGRAVYAPENTSLRQAADLKRRGLIHYIAAGPVNALTPEQEDAVLLMPEIDRLIVASEWVKALYAGAPQLAAKIRACPCGVDAAWWRPTAAAATKKTAVVYWKSGDEAFCERVEQIVRESGLQPARLCAAVGDHTRFTADDFRRMLDGATLAVFLSAFETQGLALAEAWAMDVPTLVWDPRGPAEWRGRRFVAGSSAPYLTDATGRRWQTIDELGPLVTAAIENRSAFRPRQWVLEHMTDAVCATTLYSMIRADVDAIG